MEKLFLEYHQSNSLDPDLVRHFIAPDLGPNCLQRLLADNTFQFLFAKKNGLSGLEFTKYLSE